MSRLFSLCGRVFRMLPALLCLSASRQAVDAAPTKLRGPYLQQATDHSVIVCWRTSEPGVGTVRFGTGVAQLLSSASGASAVDHEVLLSGLQPNTKYYYSIETSGTLLADGAEFFFTTPPPAGSESAIRFWVIGDCGTASIGAAAVRDSLAPFHAAKPANFWMMLGDNAYSVGLDSEYQDAVFNFYHPMLQQLPLWSTIGNHETYMGEIDGLFDYDRIFVLPTAGQCGGLASGTERYYSFDYANVHFVCLDAMTSDRSPNGAMAQWLRGDFQQNTKPWVIAFWHNPPYTKGTHDSDSGELEQDEMRQNMLPILEQLGTDLVLCGHSHVYERSYLIDGHYGLSHEFSPALHLKDGGDGRVGGDGPYRKATYGQAPHEGTVYVVNGSAGYQGHGELNHPVMCHNEDNMGSMLIDIKGGRLEAKFIRASPLHAPMVTDEFVLVKKLPPTAPSAPKFLQSGSGELWIYWEDRTDAEDEYRLVIPGEPEVILPADTTCYRLPLLPNQNTILLHVKAVNCEGAAAGPSAQHDVLPGVPVAAADRIWRFCSFGVADVTLITDDLADPDHDGAKNLLERATGSHPAKPESVPALTSSIGSDGRLRLTFSRQAIPDIRYVVEFSSNLSGDWVVGLDSQGVANTQGPVTAADPVVGVASRRFVQLRVER